MANGRKPAHQVEDLREKIWKALPRGVFSLTHIHKITNINKDTCRTYLQSLQLANYIERRNDNPLKWVVLNESELSPRIRRDGTDVTQGEGNQNLWNTIRFLKEFNHKDLAFNSRTEKHNVSDETAKSYNLKLALAGITKKMPDGSYRLIKNLGPKAPLIQRDGGVFDPNSKEKLL